MWDGMDFPGRTPHDEGDDLKWNAINRLVPSLVVSRQELFIYLYGRKQSYQQGIFWYFCITGKVNTTEN